MITIEIREVAMWQPFSLLWGNSIASPSAPMAIFLF
jgi:hypothetical protein